MQKRRTLSRRDFTLASALAALSGVTITISACGGSSSPSASTPSTPTTPPPTGGAGDEVGSVGTNHGHTAVITAAEVTAGGDVLLDIQGSADHSHGVMLSAAEVMAIAADQRVSKESDNNDGEGQGDHSHTVTFN